jgi:hypothetical protein
MTIPRIRESDAAKIYPFNIDIRKSYRIQGRFQAEIALWWRLHAYFDKLRIARSSPSMVSGNIRFPTSCSIIWIDGV